MLENVNLEIYNKDNVFVKAAMVILDGFYNNKKKLEYYQINDLLNNAYYEIAMKHKLTRTVIKELITGKCRVTNSDLYYVFGRGIFGRVKYYNIVTEFHMVNLPHVHICLYLKRFKEGEKLIVNWLNQILKDMLCSCILGSASTLKITNFLRSLITNCQTHSHNKKFCSARFSVKSKRERGEDNNNNNNNNNNFGFVDFSDLKIIGATPVCTEGFPRRLNIHCFYYDERNIIHCFRIEESDKTLNFYNFNFFDIFRAGMDLKLVDMNSLVNYLLKGLCKKDTLLRHAKRVLKFSGVPVYCLEAASAQLMNLLGEIKEAEDPDLIQVEKVMTYIKDPKKDNDAILRMITELKTAEILNLKNYRSLIDITFSNLGINLRADSFQRVFLDPHFIEDQLFRIADFRAIKKKITQKNIEPLGELAFVKKAYEMYEGEKTEDQAEQFDFYAEKVRIEEEVQLGYYLLYGLRPYYLYALNFMDFIRLVDKESTKDFLADIDYINKDFYRKMSDYWQDLRDDLERRKINSSSIGLTAFEDEKYRAGNLDQVILAKITSRLPLIRRDSSLKEKRDTLIDISKGRLIWRAKRFDRFIVCPVDLQTLNYDSPDFWRYMYQLFIPHNIYSDRVIIAETRGRLTSLLGLRARDENWAKDNLILISFKDLVMEYTDVYKQELLETLEAFRGADKSWFRETLFEYSSLTSLGRDVSKLSVDYLELIDDKPEELMEIQSKIMKFYTEYERVTAHKNNLVNFIDNEEVEPRMGLISKKDIVKLIKRIRKTSVLYGGTKQLFLKNQQYFGWNNSNEDVYKQIDTMVRSIKEFPKRFNAIGEIMSGLNSHQMAIFNKIITHTLLFKAIGYTEKGIIIQGTAGSGKTFLLKAISM